MSNEGLASVPTAWCLPGSHVPGVSCLRGCGCVTANYADHVPLSPCGQTCRRLFCIPSWPSRCLGANRGSGLNRTISVRASGDNDDTHGFHASRPLAHPRPATKKRHPCCVAPRDRLSEGRLRLAWSLLPQECQVEFLPPRLAYIGRGRGPWTCTATARLFGFILD